MKKVSPEPSVMPSVRVVLGKVTERIEPESPGCESYILTKMSPPTTLSIVESELAGSTSVVV